MNRPANGKDYGHDYHRPRDQPYIYRPTVRQAIDIIHGKYLTKIVGPATIAWPQ